MKEISGRERQLAHIARALTQGPKLLLLDEPTTHLDITHQVGILDLIKRLNREFGLTVVMTMHDLNLAYERVLELEEIIVTASRIERNLLEVSSYVNIISEKEIGESSAKNLPDLLKNLEGVYMSDSSGTGTTSIGTTAPLALCKEPQALCVVVTPGGGKAHPFSQIP